MIYAAICWKQNKMVKQIKNIIENNFNILHNKYEVPQNAIQTHKCIGHPEIDSYGIMSPETFFFNEHRKCKWLLFKIYEPGLWIYHTCRDVYLFNTYL